MVKEYKIKLKKFANGENLLKLLCDEIPYNLDELNPEDIQKYAYSCLFVQ
jgi:hypothetical protein